MLSIVQELETYVKEWNKSHQQLDRRESRSRLQLISSQNSFSLQYGCGSKIFEIRNKSNQSNTFGSIEGFVNINNAAESIEGYQLLTELSQISWKWKPPTIRSSILIPAIDTINKMYPRFGVKIDFNNIIWIPDKQLESCTSYIQSIKSYMTATIYKQESPRQNPVVIRSYDGMPLVDANENVRLKEAHFKKKVSYDFSKVADDIAEEGDLSCSVCMVNKPCATAVCGHLAACATCARKISESKNPKCPKCRGPWTELKRIFL